MTVAGLPEACGSDASGGSGLGLAVVREWAILDEFHQLPDHIIDGLPGLLQRLDQAGLDIHTSDDGKTMTAQ